MEMGLPSRLSGGGGSSGPAFGATQSSGSSLFFNVSSGAPYRVTRLNLTHNRHT
jgi:hypothetical protein